jgi:hypothetical protein
MGVLPGHQTSIFGRSAAYACTLQYWAVPALKKTKFVAAPAVEDGAVNVCIARGSPSIRANKGTKLSGATISRPNIEIQN